MKITIAVAFANGKYRAAVVGPGYEATGEDQSSPGKAAAHAASMAFQGREHTLREIRQGVWVADDFAVGTAAVNQQPACADASARQASNEET